METAYIFPQPTIAEICEQINILLDDNDDWQIKNVDIMKHIDGQYTAILRYEINRKR